MKYKNVTDQQIILFGDTKIFINPQQEVYVPDSMDAAAQTYVHAGILSIPGVEKKPAPVVVKEEPVVNTTSAEAPVTTTEAMPEVVSEEPKAPTSTRGKSKKTE